MKIKRDQPILKSPGEIEAMKEAGRVSAYALRAVGEIIRPGISTLELDQYVEDLIRMEGGKPAFKGLYGFPASICASPNSMVVHGIPSRDVILREGDIISIDTGAEVDGWIGDNAYTYKVGKVDARTQLLLAKTEEAMWAGINEAVPGNTLGDIGAAIQGTVEPHGFGVVREYVGHGVGRKMHEPPNVPNFGRRGKGLRLQAGMVIAIEPMINAGTHKVHTLADGWAVVSDDNSNSAHFEKTIAITNDGPVVLTAE